MSDEEATTPVVSDTKQEMKTVTFTEKEERVLKVAWHCLKTPPEVKQPFILSRMIVD